MIHHFENPELKKKIKENKSYFLLFNYIQSFLIGIEIRSVL